MFSLCLTETQLILIKNVISIYIDNANCMAGKQNSIISYLVTDKEVAVFSCIYYSIYLVAIHGCKHIPQYINIFL